MQTKRFVVLFILFLQLSAPYHNICTNAYNIYKEIFILCAYLNLNALFMYLRMAL